MIDYRELHRGQWEVSQSPAQFRFVLCGRGWGKDHLAISATLEAVTGPRARPGFLAGYIGPSHQQVRAIAWERFKSVIPRKYLRRKPHETNLEFEFKWGPILRLAGSDRPDSLRGPDIHNLVITEFAFCKKELWKALRPGLRTRHDRAMIITTPDGPNHCYELWNRTQGDPAWAHWQKATWDRPDHDRATVEEGRRTLARAAFDQEFGAKFEALVGAIYGDFSLEANVLKKEIELPRNTEIYVGQDYNAGLYSAVIGFELDDDLYITDELITRGSPLRHIAALQKFFEDRRIDWRRDVTIFADSSGEYNVTGAGKGAKADNVLMRSHGFHTSHDGQNPRVIDRVHGLQAQILNAEEERHLFVNERCREFIDCMLTQVWGKQGSPDKKKGKDHLPDAAGYFVWGLRPLLDRGSVE